MGCAASICLRLRNCSWVAHGWGLEPAAMFSLNSLDARKLRAMQRHKRQPRERSPTQ